MNPIISLLTQALAYPLYWHREELNAGWNLLAAILSSIVTDESGYTITAKWRVCYAVWEGSAPDIAGKGIANPGSMIAAIRLAKQLAKNKS